MGEGVGGGTKEGGDEISELTSNQFPILKIGVEFWKGKRGVRQNCRAQLVPPEKDKKDS